MWNESWPYEPFKGQPLKMVKYTETISQRISSFYMNDPLFDQKKCLLQRSFLQKAFSVFKIRK